MEEVVLRALPTVHHAQIQNVLVAHQATIYRVKYAHNALQVAVLVILIAFPAVIQHAIHAMKDITLTLELAVNARPHAETAFQIVILAPI